MRILPSRCAFLGGMTLIALALPACSMPARVASSPGEIGVNFATLTKPPDRPAPAPASSQTTSNAVGSSVASEKVDNTFQAALFSPAPASCCPSGECDRLDVWAEARPRLARDMDLVKEDYCNFYSLGNLGLVAAGVGAAAPIANSHADNAIRDWYQQRIRTKTTDAFADVANYAGQLWVILPLGLEAAALLGKAPADYAFDGGWFEWSNRCLRATAAGFPPVLAMYVVLGSGRPDRGDSRWHPFEDAHGVSGHTFIGAIPFLTGAAMTDNPWLKGTLFLGSFLTGWARINNDRHYFSQAALGWWMAYLAVRSVNHTQDERRAITLTSTWIGDTPGVGVLVEW